MGRTAVRCVVRSFILLAVGSRMSRECVWAKGPFSRRAFGHGVVPSRHMGLEVRRGGWRRREIRGWRRERRVCSVVPGVAFRQREALKRNTRAAALARVGGFRGQRSSESRFSSGSSPLPSHVRRDGASGFLFRDASSAGSGVRRSDTQGQGDRQPARSPPHVTQDEGARPSSIQPPEVRCQSGSLGVSFRWCRRSLCSSPSARPLYCCAGGGSRGVPFRPPSNGALSRPAFLRPSIAASTSSQLDDARCSVTTASATIVFSLLLARFTSLGRWSVLFRFARTSVFIAVLPFCMSFFLCSS
ncbi:hypothetical protein MTO96_018092 [Rhipicephalus appendiculatus]